MTTDLFQDRTVTVQCLPLYSILLALDNPVVDLLVLDIEGAELQVLDCSINYILNIVIEWCLFFIFPYVTVMPLLGSTNNSMEKCNYKVSQMATFRRIKH